MKLNSQIQRIKLDRFNKDGFIIEKVFSRKLINSFKNKLLINLKKSAKKKSITSIKNIKKLEEYFITVSKEEHEMLMDRETRTIRIFKSEVDSILNQKVKNLLSFYSDKKFYILRSDNKFSKEGKEFKNLAGFRIVKPNSKKVAGYHSDHYNLQNFKFTMWVPLIGFNNKYSLGVIPGSHYFKHKREQVIKNKNGSAQLFSKTYLKNFSKPIRPNLKSGEVMILHPYLIHGNAKNLGNKVRASLEIKIGTK